MPNSKFEKAIIGDGNIVVAGLSPASKRSRRKGPSTTTSIRSGDLVDLALTALGRGEELGFTQSQALELRRHAARKRDAIVARLSESLGAGQGGSARSAQRALATSRPARLAAAFEAERQAQRIRNRYRSTPESDIDLKVVAETFRSFSDHHHRPAGYTSKNAQGRLTVSLDASGRARAQLATWALRPFVRLSPGQRLLNGGVHAACEDLRQAIERAPPGAVVIKMDIKGFYPSVDHRWVLENLDIPRWMANWALTSSIDLIPVGHQESRPTNDDITATAQRGIIQGSALSVWIGELIIADVLSGIAERPEVLAVITYNDDVVIITTEAEAAFCDLLRDRVRTHPAGPFQVKHLTSAPARRPTRFLKYTFVQRFGRGWCFRHHAWRRGFAVQNRVDLDLAHLEPKSLLAKPVERLLRRVDGSRACPKMRELGAELSRCVARFRSNGLLEGTINEPPGPLLTNILSEILRHGPRLVRPA